MEKMKMHVGERLSAMGVIPKEGNFATLRLTRNLIEKLGLSADELKEFEIITDKKTGMTSWNEKGKVEKEIDLKEKEKELIKKSLLKLDKDGKLEQHHYSLCEKFKLMGDDDV